MILTPLIYQSLSYDPDSGLHWQLYPVHLGLAHTPLLLSLMVCKFGSACLGLHTSCPPHASLCLSPFFLKHRRLKPRTSHMLCKCATTRACSLHPHSVTFFRLVWLTGCGSVHMCRGTHMPWCTRGDRGQLVKGSSFLPPCESQVLNSRPQAF